MRSTTKIFNETYALTPTPLMPQLKTRNSLHRPPKTIRLSFDKPSNNKIIVSVRHKKEFADKIFTSCNIKSLPKPEASSKNSLRYSSLKFKINEKLLKPIFSNRKTNNKKTKYFDELIDSESEAQSFNKIYELYKFNN
jgi:hypothetical protein